MGPKAEFYEIWHGDASPGFVWRLNDLRRVLISRLYIVAKNLVAIDKVLCPTAGVPRYSASAELLL